MAQPHRTEMTLCSCVGWGPAGTAMWKRDYTSYMYREDRASAAQEDRMGTVWHSYRMGMA